MNNIVEFNPRQHRVMFTHTDLDGVGCAVIYSKAFTNTEVHFIDYDVVNEHIMSFIVSDDTTPIIISDLSVNDNVAKLLDRRGNVELVDHHPTAKHLDKYPWVYVNTGDSATHHLYNILSPKFTLNDYEPFVQVVNDYDTWGHNTEPQEIGKSLTKLLYIMGINRFYSRFIFTPSLDLSPTEDILLALDNEREAKYLEESFLKAQKLKDGMGNNYLLVAADQYVSSVGHALLEANPDCEYVMMVDFRKDKVSLRGKGNVHLGDLAKQAGGGGHKRAAGFPLTDAAVRMFIPCDNCPQRITP